MALIVRQRCLFSEVGPFCPLCRSVYRIGGFPAHMPVPKQLQLPLLGDVVPGVFTPVLAKYFESEPVSPAMWSTTWKLAALDEFYGPKKRP